MRRKKGGRRVCASCSFFIVIQDLCDMSPYLLVTIRISVARHQRRIGLEDSSVLICKGRCPYSSENNEIFGKLSYFEQHAYLRSWHSVRFNRSHAYLAKEKFWQQQGRTVLCEIDAGCTVSFVFLTVVVRPVKSKRNRESIDKNNVLCASYMMQGSTYAVTQQVWAVGT